MTQDHLVTYGLDTVDVDLVFKAQSDPYGSSTAAAQVSTNENTFNPGRA